MIALSEDIDVVEGFAGIAALVSGIIGLTAFGLDSIDPVISIIGFSLGVGMIPLGVYHSYNGFSEIRTSRLLKVIPLNKRELVNEELAYLADKILNGEITERIAGQEVTLGPDQPAQAAFYTTWRTKIYDQEPVAILDYTKNIPGEWREYVTEDRDEVQAMAKASFEHELYQYVSNYAEEEG